MRMRNLKGESARLSKSWERSVLARGDTREGGRVTRVERAEEAEQVVSVC